MKHLTYWAKRAPGVFELRLTHQLFGGCQGCIQDPNPPADVFLLVKDALYIVQCRICETTYTHESWPDGYEENDEAQYLLRQSRR